MTLVASLRLPRGLLRQGNRVLRGGDFNNDASNLRAANRNNNAPSNRNNDNGFRCAKTMTSPASTRGRPEGGGPGLAVAWRPMVQP